MGYDMHFRRRPEGEAEAVAAARKVFYAAAEVRNAIPRGAEGREAAQKAVEAAGDDIDAANRSYFRLNIWGMSHARGYMAERGMLCNPPCGDFPRYPLNDEYAAYEWVRYPEDRSGEEPPAEDLAVAKKHVDGVDAVLRSHEGECPGIPAWKFGSNDGWIVTPAECKAALAALDKARAGGVEDPDIGWWGEWVDYLRRAIDHDGFEVN